MKRSRWIIFAGAVLAVAALSAVAVAFWAADGLGPGDSEALSASTITVAAATGAADLYPGFTQGDVYFTSANANPYPVTLTAMTPGDGRLQ